MYKSVFTHLRRLLLIRVIMQTQLASVLVTCLGKFRLKARRASVGLNRFKKFHLKVACLSFQVWREKYLWRVELPRVLLFKILCECTLNPGIAYCNDNHGFYMLLAYEQRTSSIPCRSKTSLELLRYCMGLRNIIRL